MFELMQFGATNAIGVYPQLEQYVLKNVTNGTLRPGGVYCLDLQQLNSLSVDGDLFANPTPEVSGWANVKRRTSVNENNRTIWVIAEESIAPGKTGLFTVSGITRMRFADDLAVGRSTVRSLEPIAPPFSNNEDWGDSLPRANTRTIAYNLREVVVVNAGSDPNLTDGLAYDYVLFNGRSETRTP